MNVYTAYRSLTAEQKQFLRSKQVEADRTPDEWLALLMPIAAYDESSDKLRRRCVILIVIAIVVLFLSIFILAAAPVVGLIIVIIALAALVAAAIVYRVTSKLDLQADLRKFVLPLLTILRADARPNRSLHLFLDLRGSTIKEKQTSQYAPRAAGAYHKIVESFYTDPWMNGQMVMADGSNLAWKIVDNIRKLEKTKRNPRGKTKTKTKIKLKSHLYVQVRLPDKTYSVSERGEQKKDVGKVALAPGEERNTVKIHRVVQATELAPLEPRHFIEVVAAAFRRAEPSGRRSA